MSGGSTRTTASVPRWSWFGDAWWPKRLVAFLTLLGASAAVLGALAELVDFPPDFNGAQSATARELVQQPDRWEDWHDTAGRDLIPFIPGYTAWGTAAIAWAAWRRPLSRMSAGFMFTAGVVDAVETLLFRRTLGRLMDGATESQISTMTTVTAGATRLKWACAAAAVVLLAASILRRPHG